MKYNVEIANFLDYVTAKLRMPMAVNDNGKTMWVYDYEEHKRYSITYIVEDILCYSDLSIFSTKEVEELCCIIPYKKRREMALNEFVNDSDYVE